VDVVPQLVAERADLRSHLVDRTADDRLTQRLCLTTASL
jgi:hypothetical protein